MNERTKRIPVAVNTDDIERIKRNAQANGLPLSQYVRGALGLDAVKAGRPIKETK